MSRKFKKFASMFLAIAMTLALGSAAMAETPACAHDVPEKKYEQAVTVTIIGEDNGSTKPSESLNLPEEYHVRVVWTKADGVYNATKTDGTGSSSFKNFTWDCVTLQYKLKALGKVDGKDAREGNWVTKPAVAFEVTNASTPTLDIYAAVSLKTDDAWADYMYADSIAEQNTKFNTTAGKVLVPHVKHENMGTGVNSYEATAKGSNTADAKHNTQSYEYELNWNYDALNQAALDAYNAGSGTFDLTNTFVVTITAN